MTGLIEALSQLFLSIRSENETPSTMGAVGVPVKLDGFKLFGLRGSDFGSVDPGQLFEALTHTNT